MQFVSWATLLTLLVRDLAEMGIPDAAAAVRKDRLHPRQVKLLETLSEYEIVSPIRVNALGEPFPTNVHFKRRRRSINSATDPWPAFASSSSSSTSSQAHYRLSAFGQQFLFNLTANAGFIAPLFTVTLLGTPGVNQTKFYSEEEAELKHCFYKGYVNTKSEHTAVISLCSGMLGTFRSHDGDYFIEPLQSMDEQEDEEEQNKPHIIYRRSTPQREPSTGRHACDTSEHKNRNSKDKKKTRARKWGERINLADDVAALNSGLATEAFSAYGNKTDNTREKRTHRRTKRFLSYPRFVEVLVVADNRMVSYHGENLQHYILTLMSIVASIYKDPSIGNLINIVIVNLIVIHNEQDGPSISFNAQTTLKNFCQWQHSKNSPGGIHHDTAVLLTRQDICRAHDKCDTLGLAELGTICDPYRSCSISEDSGLSTAFTIAHELGHVFNMPHDDNNKCKEEGVKSPQHVMAPTLNFYTNPWMWSKCSRKYITEFLDTGYGECLLNEPESRPYPLPVQLPGILYNVNKQCELIFGPGSQVCPYMMQCRRLWCNNVNGVHKGCRTQHTPWADGTECEPGKHCKYGFCVPKEMDVPVTDGSWGSWSPFGTCSRTCGGGIKTAIRECNRPEPKNGGKYCVGRRMKFKSCNTEPCLKQKRDFRDEQCAHFDGKHFNINGLLPNVRWVPKYSGILMKDRCKLFCRVAGNTAYYQLRDRVIDGTPCGQDTNDICVQGLCRQAGCDHVLNSKARRDKCGVCGGDNSSCKTVAGTFNTVHYGYNTVVRIPAGATNIDVRQHSFSGETDDDNYLALSSSKGEFLLNGNFVVTMAKREIRIGNAVVEYSGSETAVERINSTDRIEQELLLQVLSVGKLYNPDVRYSFNIPIEDKPQQFYWNSHGPWQACSKPCQGERKRKLVCTRESDQLTVSDQRCDRLPQPGPITEPCGTDCDLRWHVASRSECSAQCGLGYRTLDIYCAKYSRLDGKTEKVNDGFCSSHPKPSNREKCSGECNTGGWRYSAWTECSKSCDGGTQRRRAICVNTRNDVLDDSKCTHQEKVTFQRCSEFPCPQWKSGDWSECLVTCGKGRKHRQVWCQFGEDRLNDRMCDPETKPTSMQTCQQPECASWQAGPWGQCSVTCGQGYQLRAVKCIIGTYMSVVDDNDCNAATRPTDTQDCELPSCHPPPAAPETRRSTYSAPRTQWRFGSWTPCSATCGKGTRMRYVSCRDENGSVADESACATLPRPVAKEECSVTPCGQWKALDWSSCSVTCGQGRATRQVVCVNYSDHVIDRSECDQDYIPETDQDCSMSPCPQRTPDSGLAQHPFQDEDYRPRSASPSRTHVLGGNQWRTGPWGACSSTCAGGSQRRVVVCQDENGYTANDCVERIKPDEQRACESGPCPQWAYGNWGECTKLCGGGIRTRLVVCQRSNGERFPDLSCEILDKPPDREQCNTHACPHDAAWSTGPWSSCSVSCGRGHKQRNVYCMAKDGSHLESDYCKHLAKPHGHRKCRGGRCPKWKAGAWSQCSVSCGRGVQQRHVGCQIGTHKIARETECHPYTRPESERDCQGPRCPLYTWRAEEWQECTKTCGEGSRYRKVVCVDDSKNEVHGARCDVSKRPADHESCSLQPCEYVWITGEWSECSVTCGKGYKQRLVSCSEIYTGKENYEYSYQTTVNCPGTQPPSVHPCYLRECPVSATWRVGNWGSCSVSCGVGVMQRSVQCLTNEDQPSHLCHNDLKPEERKTCRNIYNCELPQNCKEVKRLKGASEDGEYFLMIRGKLLKIFCAGMHSDHPKEYVTLVHGDSENFSEVYGHRLHNPTECPYNGSRRDDCQCRKDYTAAGFSSFQKIRIDLTSMQIITTDLQFARTSEGHPVPFATAGDCYSAAKCPQGRFSINLYGTGLSLTESARWISQGNYAVSDIKKSPDGTRVIGKCGGYCGKCTPSSGTGLEVRVL
ncbi:A disintegrin and metalloproteinase with thrombospondin motifs 9 isoform X1 [Trachypithecus francoisi]|uniref:A disintegrin and metalloproteinase with thrombospondin motifs 9 isoform X1 n=1 Tax=Trachypithecus francoisi TaxID=54180 RepID=UPI00141BB9CB|nr:A disintegrin and metalloproteinase with thrombospondin motifs 9 isoform X1 [Trachypithecus francoisi]